MDVTFRDFGPGDAGWLVQQHGDLYARAEGFDETFGALVADILRDFEAHRDPAMERAWIAWQGGARLGSIFCVRVDADTAKLRLFLLVPQVRGLGLGQRMLEECMGWARRRDYRRMVLWTHESHQAACALYRKAGWRLTRSVPVRSFGVDLVEQAWEVDL
ncbi:GNAT family N-acetyltransferase [Thalassococcus sp. CAU 1522]|uniref:GNAT family N-acetyltransferase n=1 Tax=Thalassococcus arenae TaxID=2851652 RepID=A0ABS6N8S3_9RHOB|nr:GNAT family N-acetyltransferase [Thalassococcus arenae]MBV2360415.1 GNAT family N-acetyltransferase [Thalassococcus arenae]